MGYLVKHRNPLHRILLVASMSALFALSLAATASAGDISGGLMSYTFTDSATEANSINVTLVPDGEYPGQIDITDSGATLTESSASCVDLGGGVIRCDVYNGAATTMNWNLGSNNDSISVATDVQTIDVVDGGLGADVMGCGGGLDQVKFSSRIAGVRVTPSDLAANDGETAEFDNVDSTCEGSIGGSATDYLLASSANQGKISGGDGADYIVGSTNNTVTGFCQGNFPGSMNGDGGNDLIVAVSGLYNALSGGSGNDTLVGIDTNPGCDHLYGGTGSDTISGGSGNDQIWDNVSSTGEINTIIGGAGNDAYHLGAGNDTVISRDGNDDGTLSCSTGTDTLIGDASDGPSSGCETSVLSN